MHVKLGLGSIKCMLGFHNPQLVVNLKSNKFTEICTRCGTIISVEKDDVLCCSSCIVRDFELKEKLKKDNWTILEG